MISAILDHLWQSTLLATAVAILALAFRKAPASVRYGLWFTASVKFLVPFAGLAALGRLLAPEIPPPAEAAPDAVFIAGAASPLAHTAIAPAAGVPLDPALILLGVWALGCAVVLIVWITRWARIRPLVRLAAPLALAAPMPVLASPTMLEPGLVGLWRPVLLVPETLFDHLDRPGIEALVAHEACHYRRGDNLTAAVHMLVEALFWFHPMVWWIGGRLVFGGAVELDRFRTDRGDTLNAGGGRGVGARRPDRFHRLGAVRRGSGGEAVVGERARRTGRQGQGAGRGLVIGRRGEPSGGDRRGQGADAGRRQDGLARARQLGSERRGHDRLHPPGEVGA